MLTVMVAILKARMLNRKLKLGNPNVNNNMLTATLSLPIKKHVKSATTSRVSTKLLKLAHSGRVARRQRGVHNMLSSTVLLQGTCARKLARQQIDVLQPEKIKTIADVSVVCFDKTGTLTGSVVSLFLVHGHINREAQSISSLGLFIMLKGVVCAFLFFLIHGVLHVAKQAVFGCPQGFV